MSSFVHIIISKFTKPRLKILDRLSYLEENIKLHRKCRESLEEN